MYVIADLEWIDNKRGQEYPSQLAAIRIDSDWNVISKFFCRMKPHDPSFFRWEHVAFNGGKSSDFLQAPSYFFVRVCFSDSTSFYVIRLGQSKKKLHSFFLIYLICCVTYLTCLCFCITSDELVCSLEHLLCLSIYHRYLLLFFFLIFDCF